MKTGGGAYKFADLFKEKLGVSIEKEDEIDCLVTGANFLLKVLQKSLYVKKNLSILVYMTYKLNDLFFFC